MYIYTQTYIYTHLSEVLELLSSSANTHTHTMHNVETHVGKVESLILNTHTTTDQQHNERPTTTVCIHTNTYYKCVFFLLSVSLISLCVCSGQEQGGVGNM